MQRYGIIGFPLGHSFSPAYFARKFARLGINAEYLKFELPRISDFPALIASQPDLRGLNVTIPYKQQVIPFLDELSPEAEKLGAVNCIRIQRDDDGKTALKGYNADIIGFTDSLRPLLRPEMKSALVLGTGGAAHAVVGGLEMLDIRAQPVSRKGRTGVITYDELTPQTLKDNLIIVNCTPVGMSPHTGECPALPYGAITPRHLLFDLIYNPDETLFLRKGRQMGALTKNGLEMLYGQAEASWRFWHETAAIKPRQA